MIEKKFTFKRPCKRCFKLFNPAGRGCFICPECKEKSKKEAHIKQAETLWKKKQRVN